ncbi:hypothetical protein Tco_0789236 [Tanacetum coccineum]
MGGDVERLGAVLDKSWCKEEVCGSVYGGGLAAADYGVKRKHAVDFAFDENSGLLYWGSGLKLSCSSTVLGHCGARGITSEWFCVKHVVAIASSRKNKETLAALSIVRAASTRARLRKDNKDKKKQKQSKTEKERKRQEKEQRNSQRSKPDQPIQQRKEVKGQNNKEKD